MTTETRERADLVILGSGLAGYSLARELRKLDPEISIHMVTADGGEAYSKPMLSNAIAQGKEADALIQKDAFKAAADLSLTLHTRTRVAAIDREAKRLTLEGDGGRSTLGYGRLVLAMGATPRSFTCAGSEQVPVASVNDLDDYRRWREGLKTSSRVLLIGAGLIGCEFANDLAVGGHQVTLLDPADWPLARLLPQALGREMQAALAGTGVDLRMGCAVARLEVRGGEKVAHLSTGGEIAFDRALSAIGLIPRTDLAAKAGLEVEGGIIVDRQLRTNDPDIFAMGDCAKTDAGLLPYVLPLMAQARSLAKTLAGDETALTLPALPVMVKTPALAAAVCPPPAGAEGAWSIEGEGRDRTAFFLSPDGGKLGFALTGAATGQRQALAKEMPPLLA